MRLYFRKRIGLGPLALNFSKSGIGISTGVRGLRAGISSHRGVYTSAGLPGTGVRFTRITATTMQASRQRTLLRSRWAFYCLPDHLLSFWPRFAR
jgi:hypothetical protein